MRRLSALFAVCFVGLLACGGGGGDGDGGDLTNNACGTLGLQARIVNGTECSSTDSPVVQITLITSDGRGFLCSGTMIGSQDVLTAAHCFFENPVSAFIEANGRQIDGTTVSLHPDVSANDTAIFNDVAVLHLASAAGLPTLPLLEGTEVEDGDTVQIFGFGQTEDQSDTVDTAGVLRSGEMRVSDVTENHLFAKFEGEGSNTCFGDSGGPAFLSLPNGAVGLVGVTSSGALEDCGVGDVSLFANLQNQSIFDFIVAAVPGVGVL